MAQPGDLAPLSNALSAFADERDWKQFHSPKNLAMALSVEAGELLEHFQWLTEEESRNLDDRKLTENPMNAIPKNRNARDGSSPKQLRCVRGQAEALHRNSR